jgi:hypothetical protein
MTSDSNLLVVYCPGRAHTEAAVLSGESHAATPKILFVAERGLEGRLLVQCGENRCKHSQGERYNGWYEITIKASGTYTIRPVSKQKFKLVKIPGVVLE